MSQDQPKRRVHQFVLESAKNLVSGVGAVVVLEFLKRVGLGGLEKGPELVFGDKMLGVRDVALLEDAIPMLTDEKIRDVFLEGQLGGLLLSFSHAPLPV